MTFAVEDAVQVGGLAGHGRGYVQIFGQIVEHVQVFQDLSGETGGGEITGQHAGEDGLQHVATGMAGGQGLGYLGGIDATRFRQGQGLSQNRVIVQDQDLIDHLGDLAGAAGAHMGELRRQIGHQRRSAGDIGFTAARHDGQAAGAGRRRAA